MLKRLCIGLLFVAGCSRTDTASTPASKPVIYTVNYPLKYFAEQIGGVFVDVKFPCPKGEDPDFWKPDAATVEAYQKADLILLNGAGYGRWTEKASLPLAKSVDTAAPFRDRFITIESAVTHSHGPAGEHSHSGTASMTWLDFDQARNQAASVRDALKKLIPAKKSDLDARFAELEKILWNLDGKMKALGSKIGNRPVMASHPVYQYLARAYGLNLKAVHWEPNEVPDDKMIAELKKILEAHSAIWMIWEDEPKPETVAKLKALGLSCAVFKPGGEAPDEGNFAEMMRVNIENMFPIGN